MLKKLKRTFAVLSTALTGLVLLAACLFAYRFSRIQIENTHREAFEYQSQTLSVLLAGSNRLDHNQIVQMEQEGGLYIYLFDNGNPIAIANAVDTAFRDDLYNVALEQLSRSDSDYIISPSQRYGEPVNFSTKFSAQGQAYLAKFISAPTGARQWYSIILAKPIIEASQEIAKLKTVYIGIFFGGLLLLGLISWWLAKRSVTPVEKAQQKQKEFIATASHELKSPLAVVVSSVDIAEQNPANAGIYLHNIREEAKRMSSLVEDLLLLAGSETGKWSIKKTPANLEDVLVGCYECYAPIAKDKNQRLSLKLPEYDLPLVNIDEERIVQTLSILLSNAIFYSPDNSEIKLQGAMDNKHILLSVVDHGVGVSPDEKARIFDSFYRTQQSHTDKSHFGLGLAVAKELVELHNGQIVVQDTPGGGATFIMKLPVL